MLKGLFHSVYKITPVLSQVDQVFHLEGSLKRILLNRLSGPCAIMCDLFESSSSGRFVKFSSDPHLELSSLKSPN